LAKVELGYPTLSETVEILSRYESISSLDALKPVLTREDVLNLISLTKKVYVEQNVLKYIAAIIEATREHRYVKLGASPRGAISPLLLVKSCGSYQGKSYVTPDDVKYVAYAALSHRIILKSETRIANVTPRDVISDVLEKIEPP
jgi:MoxR-like ATPase